MKDHFEKFDIVVGNFFAGDVTLVATGLFGPGLLHETRVSRGHRPWYYIRRYASAAQARRYHPVVVDLYKRHKTPERWP